MELLASGEPEKIEHLSDEELDDRTRAPRPSQPRRLRTVAPLVAALTVGALLGGTAMSGWRDREQRDRAASTAALGLTFHHAEQGSDPADPSSELFGVVLVYLVLENRSPGPIRVESLRPVLGGGVKRVDVPAWRARDLAAGATVRVRLDVLPECGGEPVKPLPALRLAVTPAAGGMRDVQVQSAELPEGYTQAAANACSWLEQAAAGAGLELSVSEMVVTRRGGRTGRLLLRVQVTSVDGRRAADGSVAGAELSVPGVRVGHPTMPVPLADDDSAELVFGLTVDDCDVALAGGPGVLRVSAKAGDRSAILDDSSNPSLGLELLRYANDVCR